MIEKIKETGVYFVGTIGVAVMSFVISLLYSRMFSAEAYGYYSLISALYNLIYQFFTGWMTHSILRFSSEECEKDAGGSLKSTMFFIHICLSMLFFIVMICLSYKYKHNYLMYQMILIYIGIFLFEGLLLIFNTFLRAEGNSRQYSINTVANSIIKSVLIIVLYFLCGLHLVSVIILSLFISESIQVIYLFVKYKWYRIINVELFSRKITRKVIAFGYPLIGVSIIFQLLTYSDRYIIQLFMTTSDVGMYSYGYNMGYSLFYTMTNAIMLGAYPRITKEWTLGTKETTEKLITNYLNLYFYLMVPATLGIIAIGNKMIQILCGVEYWNSSGVFIITCVSYSLYGFLQYTNKAWELTKRTKMILTLNIIAALVNILLNFLLVPIFGFIIAAFTTMISFIVYIILSLILSKNIIRFYVDKIAAVKIAIAGCIMFVFEKMINMYFKSIITFFIDIFFAVALYCFILILLRDKNIINLLKKL